MEKNYVENIGFEVEVNPQDIFHVARYVLSPRSIQSFQLT